MRLLVLLSIAYSITVALVAVFDGPVRPVAIVGAVVTRAAGSLTDREPAR